MTTKFFEMVIPGLFFFILIFIPWWQQNNAANVLILTEDLWKHDHLMNAVQ